MDILHLIKTTQLVYMGIGLIIFISSFILSTPILWCIKKYAHKIGLLDQPGHRKIHSNAMPVGGGIAIFLGTLISLILGFICLWLFEKRFPLWLNDTLVILVGAIAIFTVGLIDDLRSLGPKSKLLVQAGVGTLLFFYDIRITFFIHNQFISYLITLFWIILITNAFNLLDNMDGLSSGVAFISGLIFLWVSIAIGQWLVSFLLLGLLGALLAFLRYNFSPASIFMGDCGSLFIGYMMSVLTICITFYQTSFPLFHIAFPVVVFAVPLFDTLTVVVYRFLERRPIFQGDKNHFSHRLVSLGMSSRNAVLVIYLVTFATGISAVLLNQLDWFGALIVIIQLLSILLVIHFLEQTGRNKAKN